MGQTLEQEALFALSVAVLVFAFARWRKREREWREMLLTTRFEPKVGKIIFDNDPRVKGYRALKIIYIGDTHVTCLECNKEGVIKDKYREIKIRIDRLRPTKNGYRETYEAP